MSEHQGKITSINIPRIVLRDDRRELFTIEFKDSEYIDELARLGGHVCHLGIGVGAMWTAEDRNSGDSRRGVFDIVFDLPDADPNEYETSTIVRTHSDGKAAFAERNCGCSIHVSRIAVVDETGRIGDWYGTFQIGDVVSHRHHLYNQRLEASHVSIPENGKSE